MSKSIKKIKQSLYSRLAGELHVMTESFGEDEVQQTRKDAQQRFADMVAMESSLLSEDDAPSSPEVLEKLRNGDFDTSPESFYNSYRSKLDGKNASALSAYSLNDFKKMRTFKVLGEDIGFALKGGDEIVSVFNSSAARNIGDELIKAAIRVGGKRLDHYDGFLTGFYRRNGFEITTVVEWDDEYAPKGWPYAKININDPKQSVYANEYSERPERGGPEWMAKTKQYLAGKSDVIYRSI